MPSVLARQHLFLLLHLKAVVRNEAIAALKAGQVQCVFIGQKPLGQ